MLNQGHQIQHMSISMSICKIMLIGKRNHSSNYYSDWILISAGLERKWSEGTSTAWEERLMFKHTCHVISVNRYVHLCVRCSSQQNNLQRSLILTYSDRKGSKIQQTTQKAWQLKVFIHIKWDACIKYMTYKGLLSPWSRDRWCPPKTSVQPVNPHTH